MYLLDTNVISELRKSQSGRAAPSVIAWAAAIPAASMFLSVISVLEIELGVLRVEQRDDRQGAILRYWLNHHLLPAFADRILPIDTQVALRTAALHHPKTRPERDALIAATAFVHGMIVVTRNTADFRSTGVALVDPWHT